MVKFNSNYFRKHLKIIKQDATHYWVVCTVNGEEVRYCSDNVQFCRRCLEPDRSPQEQSNGVSYPTAAYNLWKECMLANDFPFLEKVRNIKNIHDLCKVFNSGEPIDLQKFYDEHPSVKDIADPESVLICHDEKHIIIKQDDGKFAVKRYKESEVKRYFEALKKSDM